ncbi:MAG: hypothetical protein K1060chlam5_00452 [Candidatus Anoxychlamydiales bacterium]|nr:hypothetical protein [Candidatus Anoxychlamydiales bacterium]
MAARIEGQLFFKNDFWMEGLIEEFNSTKKHTCLGLQSLCAASKYTNHFFDENIIKHCHLVALQMLEEYANNYKTNSESYPSYREAIIKNYIKLNQYEYAIRLINELPKNLFREKIFLFCELIRKKIQLGEEKDAYRYIQQNIENINSLKNVYFQKKAELFLNILDVFILLRFKRDELIKLLEKAETLNYSPSILRRFRFDSWLKDNNFYKILTLYLKLGFKKEALQKYCLIENPRIKREAFKALSDIETLL